MARPAQLQGISPERYAAGGRVRRLGTVRGARILVADTLRTVENEWDGKDLAVAKVLIDGAKVLASLIEASDTESKLLRLERAGTRTLPASPVLERPQPAPRREYTAPDRSKGSQASDARPEASAALATPDKP